LVDSKSSTLSPFFVAQHAADKPDKPDPIIYTLLLMNFPYVKIEKN
jgi:hypothetical protein